MSGNGLLAGSARTVTTIAGVRAAADAVRAAGGRVGFFGTSGALHEGHLTVIRRMAAECELSIMPLFLAPVPGVTSDAVPAYDRDFDADAALAFDAGVNLVFRPAVAEMYPDLPVRTAVVPADELAAPWENAEDPSFLRMAATALAKYYNIVGPCRAYTGEKDWVPLTVLRRMVVDLSIRAEIVACPVVRLADGLCASSRNRRLSAADRAAAPTLYAALRGGRRRRRGGRTGRGGDPLPAAATDRRGGAGRLRRGGRRRHARPGRPAGRRAAAAGVRRLHRHPPVRQRRGHRPRPGHRPSTLGLATATCYPLPVTREPLPVSRCP
ncbi:pantoate--beta-alanine ligase [Frankia sp. ArI3]|nr:pantoate--beta-alanine ligase [Frankia sp. ArI3]